MEYEPRMWETFGILDKEIISNIKVGCCVLAHTNSKRCVCWGAGGFQASKIPAIPSMLSASSLQFEICFLSYSCHHAQ